MAASVDMNDRALREIGIALGGVGNGFPREDGFDIIAASEVMAVFCLAENLETRNGGSATSSSARRAIRNTSALPRSRGCRSHDGAS